MKKTEDDYLNLTVEKQSIKEINELGDSSNTMMKNMGELVDGVKDVVREVNGIFASVKMTSDQTLEKTKEMQVKSTAGAKSLEKFDVGIHETIEKNEILIQRF